MTAVRLTKGQRTILERMDNGWRPLWLQLGATGRTLERRGLISVGWGPASTPDHDKLCAFITPLGYAALHSRSEPKP